MKKQTKNKNEKKTDMLFFLPWKLIEKRDILVKKKENTIFFFHKRIRYTIILTITIKVKNI